MTELIPVNDPNLANRIKTAVADLEEYYPDRKVHHLDGLHKSLGKRLSKLYAKIGYDSREQFLNAYGFETTKTANTGGRPTTLDPEALLSQLAARYEGKDKPTSQKVLAEENPDLKGQLKSLSNKCTDLYGKTLKKLLIEREIIVQSGGRAPVTEEELTAALEEMKAICNRDPEPASSQSELLGAHPEFSQTLRHLQLLASTYYDSTPGQVLKRYGIIRQKKAQIAKLSTEEADAIMAELADALHPLPYFERPKNLTELGKIDPDLMIRTKAAMRQNFFKLNDLKSLGLFRAGEERMRHLGIREADVTEIAPLVAKLIGTEVIGPEDDLADLLPNHCVAADLKNLVEIQEAMICLNGKKAAGLEAGTDIELTPEETSCNRPRQLVLSTAPAHLIDSIICRIPAQGEFSSQRSPLDELQKGTVIRSASASRNSLAWLRVWFAVPLRPSTLAHILRDKGLLTKEDIAGDLTWRYRLEKVEGIA